MVFGGEGRGIACLRGARDPRECVAVVGAHGIACNSELAVGSGVTAVPRNHAAGDTHGAPRTPCVSDEQILQLEPCGSIIALSHPMRRAVNLIFLEQLR